MEVHADGLSGLCSLWGGSDDCLDVGLRDVTSDVRDALADLLFKELTDENIDLPNSVTIDGWNITFPKIFQNISLSVVDITNIVAMKMSINDPAVGLLCPEKPLCTLDDPDVRPCARGTCVRSVPPNPIAPDMGHCECLKDPCETPAAVAHWQPCGGINTPGCGKEEACFTCADPKFSCKRVSKYYYQCNPN